MNGKLYAFGCSHTAGHSLDPAITRNALLKWYKAVNVNDFNGFCNRLTERKREWYFRTQWHKHLQDVPGYDFPENSYAAHLANNLNLEYLNFAKSGTGIDTVYMMFKEQLEYINWDIDVVTIELPPIERYQSRKERIIYGLHYKDGSKYMPLPESMTYFYSGIISLLSKYPVHFINVMGDRHLEIKDHIDITPLNAQSLEDLCKENKMPRYPSGHFWYESHLLFANKLGENI